MHSINKDGLRFALDFFKDIKAKEPKFRCHFCFIVKSQYLVSLLSKIPMKNIKACDCMK